MPPVSTMSSAWPMTNMTAVSSSLTQPMAHCDCGIFSGGSNLPMPKAGRIMIQPSSSPLTITGKPMRPAAEKAWQ